MQKPRVIVFWLFVNVGWLATSTEQYQPCPFAQIIRSAEVEPLMAENYIEPKYSSAPTYSSLIRGYLNGDGVEPYYPNDDQLYSDNMILKFLNEVKPSESLKCATPPATCVNDTNNYYYRTFDGSCNNLRNPGFGMAGSRYGRLLPPNYSENGRPTISKNGKPLPGARTLSLSLFGEELQPDPIRTLSVMQFGQIVAHDISSLSTKGAPADCCKDILNEKCYPIPLVPNGPIAVNTNKRCLPFSRAIDEKDAKCEKNPYYAEKLSTVTAFLDLSSVYSSSREDIKKYREYSGGLLKTSFINNRQWLPISNNLNGECGGKRDDPQCFNVADFRNQFIPTITALQIILLREHNRIACALSKLNPQYSDEQLFQEARKINIAQYQHITYYEWLPTVMGAPYAYTNRLIYNVENVNDYVNDYDERVQPVAYVESAASAFRSTHAQIPGFFSLVNSNNVLNETKRLSDYFQRQSNIDFITSGDNLDSIVRGLASQPQKQTDDNIDKEIKHYFNRKPDEKFGGDLKSMDINRGRDFGVPSYNDLREYCGLGRAYDWEEFAPQIPYEKIEKLRSLYDSTDDVDLNVGGSLETLEPGSLFGPTFQCILGRQLLTTRTSDRFFYENENIFSGFTRDQLAEIRKASLAGLYCNNGDYIKYMQPNAFIIPNPNNILRSCDVIPQVDLSKWKATPQILY